MDYQLVVIGSGPGGYVAAIRASQLGMKVALIEEKDLGGVCLNRGCVPTKALLKSAQVYQSILGAASYGISVPSQAEADLAKIVERSRGVASKMSRGVEFLMKKNNIDIIKGKGKIEGANTMSVFSEDGTKKISAENIIIAIGARPREIPILKFDGKNIIDSTAAMTRTEQPKSMIVVGSGAIGVEFAHFYSSIGTKVTIIETMDKLLPIADNEVSATLEREFRKAKIDTIVSAEIQKAECKNGVCTMTVSSKKGEKTIEADVILSSVGIVANIDNVGLEEAGISTEKGKIVVDKNFQTNIKGIYAIGDVINTPALAHVASTEAIRCVEKIAGKAVEEIDYSCIPWCIYTSPEIAAVGLTEAAAIEKGYDIIVGKFPFTASGKASATGKIEGFVKVIFDKKTDLLLGAHIIGDCATEIISSLVLLKQAGLKGKQILETVHAHPTMNESILEAVAAAYQEAIHI